MSSTVTAEQIETRVRDAISTFGPEPDEVTRDATFEALDIDSLDLVELAQIVEEEYGVRIEPADMKDLKTVGDAIDLVAARAS
jgi:acyl carrier protein